jgi:Uma2 family endonuclease
MPALPQALSRMTEAEYLEFERASEWKHEFIDGEVLAMTGASRAHNLICTTTSFLLYSQLRGRSCEIYSTDMRVKVEATGLYTYPDISVVCGDPQFADDEFDTLLNPTVLIEVLSPSTERYDRGRKFQHYRELPSLREYVLIAQDSPRIERYLRQKDGVWQFTDAKEPEASLELTSIGCTLALAEVYEQVDFTEAEDDTDDGEKV